VPEPYTAGQWTVQTAPQWKAWNKERDDLLVDLLHAMAQALEYKFDKESERRAIP
jgi:hypothetical protein